ncbi:hypothetical protein STANM309S_02710 [Streptomyces tanashiensis]
MERLALDLGIPEASGWNGGLARPGRWAHELAQGSPAAPLALFDDARRYFETSVEPLWPRIRRDALTDRALRSEMLLRGGVDALLTTLGTTWRWQPPTLHLPSASTYDIPLCGRGLLLVPSWFATGPMVMYRPEAATVLVYPMYDGDDAVPAGASGSTDDRPEALAALLGRTRARVLTLLRSPATTTALAERASVSLAAASQHAGVLRAPAWSTPYARARQCSTASPPSGTPCWPGSEGPGRRHQSMWAAIHAARASSSSAGGSSGPQERGVEDSWRWVR